MTTFTWPNLTTKLLSREDLTEQEARWAMDQVMTGQSDPIALGGFLVALRAKGESLTEISAFSESILDHAVPLPVEREVLDIVGTGGDRSGTVNISSMASIVVSAAGVPVLKHGNRAVSSKSGSSDFFEQVGVDLTASPEKVAQVFEKVGIGFAFAPVYHGGFKYAGPTRAALGIPTVFNFLGPLCNPARPRIQAIGVASQPKLKLVSELLAQRGDTGLVFRGEDGLDELTTTGPSEIWQIQHGELTHFDLDPARLGIRPADLEDLVGGSAAENAEIAMGVLAGEEGSVRDIVLLNAAAGLVAALLYFQPESSDDELEDRFADALEVAAESIDTGAAKAKLDEWVAEYR